MWIWLSHTLNPNTEGYRGEKSLRIRKVSKISKGDSSNSINFSMHNHLGTHVDVPFHFLNDGSNLYIDSPIDFCAQIFCILTFG